MVGLGASAGGLEVLTRFLQAMPSPSGMAFVVIQHLNPTHASLTAELLGRHTQMPVLQVVGDTPIAPDHVYVIPPNRYLGIRQGVLQLTAPAEGRGTRMPVDFFFRRLAEDRQERAIGIVLSGSGTDGTLGLKEIKSVGGMALVQDPATAQHDGMPRSAIAADAADLVLAVDQMPDVLLKYARHPYVAVTRASTGALAGPDDLTGILALIRARLRFDFGGYKPGTLVRRVRRRMGLRHVERLPDYLQLLRGDPDELRALFKDLLIGVTRFFRDPEAWQYLRDRVLRPLLQGREPGSPLRAWVAGCGTGEEAYTLAMLLLEEAQAAQWSGAIQVFASDVDRTVLDIARAGAYPESIAADVSTERLRRFFTKEGSQYRVSKELRESIVFAHQNLLADPPFSKLDLIACRNLLIYVNGDVQKRVVALFHFALMDGGCLFLGTAETSGAAQDLFVTVSKRWRIYRRVGPGRHDALLPPARSRRETVPEPTSAPAVPARAGRLLAQVQQMLLERFAPAGVVINRRHQIVLFLGPTDRYLSQPAGPPTDDLLARVREGLRTRLRALVARAIAEEEPQVEASVRVRWNGERQRVRIRVEPLAPSGEADELLLISFVDEPGAEPEPAGAAVRQGDESRDDSVRQLEAELKATREDLQTTIEEQEAANEELKAAHEEVMSVNEELQSTNEELETSKEELQSLNEELSTVNAQLQAKVEELGQSNNDLDNLLTSTNIATLFLDRRLHVRRFTPAATRLFTLIPTDVGRPLADVTQRFTDPALLTDAVEVLETLAPRRAEVVAPDGRSYMRQILPYRTQDDRIDGVVVTISDVAAEVLQTARADLEAALQSLREQAARLRGIVDTAADAIVTVDASGIVLTFNRAAERVFGYAATEIIGKNARLLVPRAFRREYEAVVTRFRGAEEPPIVGLHREVQGRRKDGTLVWLDVAVSEFSEATGRRFTGIARDLTERRLAEERLREHQAQLAHVLRVKTAGELAASLAHQLNQPLSAIANHVHSSLTHLEAGQTAGLRQPLRHAAAEAQRAAAVLRRFADLLRKAPLQLRVFDARDVVRGAALLVRPQLARQQVTLSLDLPPDPLPVRADRIQIEQVVLNLLQNAFDAVRGQRPRGRIGAQVIRLGTTQKAARLIQVAVEDNGPPVSAHAAEHMFEPFFTTKRGGLGMGLTIARAIVEAHGGQILVERRPRRRGVKVSFTLPAYHDRKTRRDPRAHRIRRRR